MINNVGRDNIIVQIAGQNKLKTIDTILNGGQWQQDKVSVHVLIRIKSNERYNSLFVTTFNNDDNNSVDF